MPIVKYPHITNEHIDQLMQNGWKTNQIAEFYQVPRNVIDRRIDTIRNQKQTGKWYADRREEKPIPKLPKRADNLPKHLPIWELPKMNGEVEIYGMELAKVWERYGKPGALRQPLPANLWSREGIV